MTIEDFAALHTSTGPLAVSNLWDAGRAAVVARAGAKAIATGSLSLAGSQGFEDGEVLPFDALLATVGQVGRVCGLPLSVDVEKGYAASAEGVRDNLAKLREAGAIGCNLEDRLIVGKGLRDVPDQCERIEAAASAGLFVNARTAIFLEPLMRARTRTGPTWSMPRSNVRRPMPTRERGVSSCRGCRTPTSSSGCAAKFPCR